MPSSLAVIHSSTLGSSPHPPVSVYGTGRHTLNALAIFLRVCLPALSDRPKTLRTVRFQLAPTPFNALFRQRAAVSLPGLARCLHGGRQNLNWLPITLPSRVTLRPRLTLIRLTLFRKPWVFGVDISISIVVTYAYIFFSHRSSKPHGSPSTPVSMLPYHCIPAVLGFGAGLDARSSSTRHRSTSELLRTL